MNRYKPVGWRNDSYRHSLAAKRIKTVKDYNKFLGDVSKDRKVAEYEPKYLQGEYHKVVKAEKAEAREEHLKELAIENINKSILSDEADRQVKLEEQKAAKKWERRGEDVFKVDPRDIVNIHW